MVGRREGRGADTPALGSDEHAPAAFGLEVERRSGDVDEAADLLLEVQAAPPKPDIEERRPARIEVPDHPRELLATFDAAQEFADQARAILDRRARRPIGQEFLFAAFLDAP